MQLDMHIGKIFLVHAIKHRGSGDVTPLILSLGTVEMSG
jgi:hypothetical protein